MLSRVQHPHAPPLHAGVVIARKWPPTGIALASTTTYGCCVGSATRMGAHAGSATHGGAHL